MAISALVADSIQKNSAGLITDWLGELKALGGGADHRMSEAELKEQGTEFVGLLVPAVASGTDITAEAWRPVREFLERTSRSRALQGFTSSETARS